jgi:hypothetical protein
MDTDPTGAYSRRLSERTVIRQQHGAAEDVTSFTCPNNRIPTRMRKKWNNMNQPRNVAANQRGLLRGALLSVLVAALAIPGAAAYAAPPDGVGEETLGNNLSVPAIFVQTTDGAPSLRLPCSETAQAPGADGALPSSLYPGYWLQKTDATWSATCLVAESATVTADWGDNLTTAGSLTAGKPIRVEVGLFDPAAVGLTGYAITNLTPLLEDRIASYGTRGLDGDAYTTGDAGAPVTRVWDPAATLTIEQLVDGSWVVVVPTAAMSAEINSTGSVVYGFNWGSKGRKNTPSSGDYRATFTTSGATTINAISDESGINVPTFTVNSTTLEFSLAPQNRGGGGGSSGGPGQGGGGQGPGGN